ncbi:hypothetical protein BJ165DRAFT_1502899 [Panaeolus papilionaceus]|nr:hypothetical protein BJ165DRAFT_1502899 [Panaeolus papilionaceus]
MNPELLIRLAKRGKAWGSHELAAYNIQTEQQDAAAFFEVDHDNLPDPHVPPDLLEKLEAKDMTNREAILTTNAMDLAMGVTLSPESAVVDFVRRIFDMVNYYFTRNTLLCSRKNIKLMICGVAMHAKTDVCLQTIYDEILLLFQEDKQYLKHRYDPEAQLIAVAIAAFQNNNEKHALAHLEPLQQRLFPGFVMVGTAPVFYKIYITKELADAVKYGTFPPTPTVVHFHVPSVPRPDHRLSEGMKPLDNRCIILRCFEPLKKFIVLDPDLKAAIQSKSSHPL